MAMLKLTFTKGTHLKLAPTKVHPRMFFRTFVGVGSWVQASSAGCSWVPTSSWYKMQGNGKEHDKLQVGILNFEILLFHSINVLFLIILLPFIFFLFGGVWC